MVCTPLHHPSRDYYRMRAMTSTPVPSPTALIHLVNGRRLGGSMTTTSVMVLITWGFLSTSMDLADAKWVRKNPAALSPLTNRAILDLDRQFMARVMSVNEGEYPLFS